MAAMVTRRFSYPTWQKILGTPPTLLLFVASIAGVGGHGWVLRLFDLAWAILFALFLILAWKVRVIVDGDEVRVHNLFSSFRFKASEVRRFEPKPFGSNVLLTDGFDRKLLGVFGRGAVGNADEFEKVLTQLNE